MMYEFALDQFKRLGFTAQMARIDADEDGYLDTFSKLVTHFGNLKSSQDNNFHAAVASSAMRATARGKGDDDHKITMTRGDLRADDHKITMTRGDLRALMAREARVDEKPSREITCDGCQKTFADYNEIKMHRSKHQCKYNKCEKPDCPEPSSHCTSRHDA